MDENSRQEVVSQVSINTPRLKSHYRLVDYYGSKVAPWQEI